VKTLYLLSAAAAVGAIAVPAAAQQPYSYPYAQPAPQPYPGQPGYGYQQPTYGYQQPSYGYQQPGYGQPYGTTNPVEQIINQLLGNDNRYNVSERTLVSRCASAAVAQAQAQYGGNNRYGAYGQRYGYNQPYANNGYGNGYNNGYSQMRITAISNVERRRYGQLRVTGMISSGSHAQPYGNAYGYQNNQRYDQRYAQQADLSFRCNVDNRGAVSGIRISRAYSAYRR
jgi:hypothetical protein